MNRRHGRARRARATWTLAALLGAWSSIAHAQTPPQAAAPPDYVIQPGDQIEISTWQRPNLSRRLKVEAGGTINLPELGRIQAAGRTAAQVAKEIRDRWAVLDATMTDIDVAVVDYRVDSVYLMGEVLRPGKIEFAKIPDLWQILRDAGGAREGADLKRVKIVRGSGEDKITLLADVDAFLREGDASALPEIQADDTIIVSPENLWGFGEDVAYIMGEVGAPGVYKLTGANDLLGLVLRAGGPSPEADLSDITVIRRKPGQPRILSVNLTGYTRDGRFLSNPVVYPGDTVTIPRRERPVARFFGGVAQSATILATVASIFTAVAILSGNQVR